MKLGFATLLAVLALLSAFAPSTARAQAMTNCSNGCYIMTCNATLCTLWRCDGGGCSMVTAWDRELVEAQTSTGQAPATSAREPEVAYASVCAPGRRCDLYELTTTEALKVGSFDNVADLVQQRESLRGEIAPTH